MKTIKTFILFGITAIFFSACDVIGLGSMLDLEGPVVEITAPYSRKAVSAVFDLEGTASDNTSVAQLLIKADIDNEPFRKQWRYNKNKWEISADFGNTWNNYTDAEWTSQDGFLYTWKVKIDMSINGFPPLDGEYLFSVQAWDTSSSTNENSFKTRVFIIDNSKPSVDVSNPYLYSRTSVSHAGVITNPDLLALHDFADNSDERFKAVNIGKFITNEFDLVWQIEENHNIDSVEILLYQYDIVVDEDPTTPITDDYNKLIYRYFASTELSNGNINPKPNGRTLVPALSSSQGSYQNSDGSYRGEIVNPITEKTTIRVVAICHDVAGNYNEERTIGFFIYWEKADEPWITYSANMEGIDLNDYLGKPITTVQNDIFLVYPNKGIKATAYQAHGVKEVIYSLYKISEAGGNLGVNYEANPVDGFENQIIVNPPRNQNIYSTIFSWEFTPPPRAGFYIIEAVAYGKIGQQSEVYKSIFKIQDVSFPDFPEPPSPAASVPLFQFIGRPENQNALDNVPPDTIRISGTVSDAKDIKSLTMVWINPNSAQYAAMSQLEYFRDKEYNGWKDAQDLGVPTESQNSRTRLERSSVYPSYPFDPAHPNRLWNIFTKYKEEDPDTYRQVYSYSVLIPLTELNIGLNNQPLSSQVFLLRVENNDGKCAIITYAPQGDTSPPLIEILNVQITGGAVPIPPCEPGKFAEIPKFAGGETITVTGKWRENSAEFLAIDNYFSPDFLVSINSKGNKAVPEKDIVLDSGIIINLQPSTLAPEGTWTASYFVTNDIAKTLRDTLVISVNARDFGGNETETGASWLIQTDTLRINRISADNPDQTYKEGDTINVFIEFNKPVRMVNYNQNTQAALVLNLVDAGGTSVQGLAVYRASQASLNTRHYFDYIVSQGHNTPILNTPVPNTIVYLDISNISTPGSSASVGQNNYPFRFNRTGTSGEIEEIRITQRGTGNTTDNTIPSGAAYYVRDIPTTAISAQDNILKTLAANKNIVVDTKPPSVVSVTANTAQGHYNTNAVIYFTVKFSKPVNIGTGSNIPRLNLTVGTVTTRLTSSNPEDIRLNGDSITFAYTVQAGDNSAENPISLTNANISGSITDLAGTPFPANGITTSQVTKVLTGIYADTVAPAAPTVRVLHTYIANPSADTNVLSQNVSGTSHIARSTQANRALSNVYNENLWLSVQRADGSHAFDCLYLEYSLDNGANWTRFTNISNTPIPLTKLGSNNIIARQVDYAGNYVVFNGTGSAPAGISPAVSFNWDPGNIISRVTSTNANGIYTHVSGRNDINITVHFRKPVYVSSTYANTIITLNATNNGQTSGTRRTAQVSGGSMPTTQMSSLSFTYRIQDGDGIPGGSRLDVYSIAGLTLRDGTSTTNGVQISIPNAVSGHILPAFDTNKNITIETGSLSIDTAPQFISDSSAGTGFNIETNSNFHGVRSDDGSYWTTLEFSFNHAVSKNDGNITIEQNSSGYRLPAVLTEMQYNRFRSVENFDTYYKKGTNGYIDNQGADISTKYILQYNYNPSGTANSNITGDTAVHGTFMTAFRAAERITIPINAQTVTIDDKKVIVRLSGSNAPQVPGATYTVSFPAGIVIDSLGNTNAALTYNAVSLPGVAKPFVRIRKTQDTIVESDSPSMTQPRLVATQPLLAYARMDSRTPNATVRHTVNDWYSTTTGNNWSTGGTPQDSSGGATRPSNPTATTPDTPVQIILGTNSGTNANQGYQWWTRAVATATINSTAYISYETEEMAYRTVITYQLRNGTSAITASAGQSIMESGDQIWLRGGDAIGSSSIPGFPFTWEDNWSSLSGRRAGIRLMTKVPDSAISTIVNVTFGTPANTTAYEYTATDRIGDTGLVMPVLVNGAVRYLRVISGSGNTFRLYQTTAAAETNSAGNGVNAGNGITTLTVTGPAKNMSGANALDQNTYVGVSSPGNSNSTVTVTINGQTRYIRVLSNTNRSFKVFANENDANNATTTTGTGLNIAGYPISIEGSSSNLNNSVWRFVTWDINATAYVDFIRGRDLAEGEYTASSAAQAWQYGPRRWAYQRAGWTSFKYQYPIYPGKHRWCDAGQDHAGKNAINFSGTFSARSSLNADYNAWPGINTQ